MLHSKKNSSNFPTHFPMIYSGKLTSKVVIKDDYVRTDGTCALYLQMFLNKDRKRMSLNISVKPIDFDKIKQRVKSTCPHHKDFNLLIEKTLGDLNRIEVNYRLGNQMLTMEKLLDEYENPSSRLDFIKFWEKEMERQKGLLKPGTYRQQMSMVRKLKAYRKTLYFYDITEEMLENIKGHFKKKLLNGDATVNTFVKSFKKYLHIAEKRGIVTPLDHADIHLKQFKGQRTYLTKEDLQKLFKFWKANGSAVHKTILARFMFSCFTGLRLSDIQKLTPDNFVDDILVFTSEKTNKFQRIQLNKSALRFVDKKYIFGGDYSGEYINRELKTICLVMGIHKRVTFHVARHTFATNFLISGGRVEHLQKLLGHSKITDTMIYVHIAESVTNDQIFNMDDLLKM